MKAMLDVIQLWLLTAVGLVVTVILGDTALRYFEARPDNPLVDWFRRWAESLTPLPALDVFPDQEYWQTTVLAVLLWALAAALFVMLFRALRSAAARLEARDSAGQA